MISIKDFSDEELKDRIQFIEEEAETMTGAEFDREWKSEYEVAIRELKRRTQKER